MKNIKRLFVLLLSFVCLFTLPVGAIELDGRMQYVFIHDLVDFIEENAKFPEDKNVLLDNALYARLTNPEAGFNGMVEAVMASLDEHSGYMTEETYNAFIEDSVSGAFSGIGVTLSNTKKGLVVISAFPGSPADKAGIETGDILIAVDGEDIRGMEFQAARGKITGPEGTTVQITVQRGEKILTLTVMRAVVEMTTVAYEIIEGIGHLVIASFNETTAEDVAAALAHFEKEGVRDVILDLRDNPGGEMHAALDICRQLTPRGVILRVEYAKENQLYYNETDNSGRFNLAVLVNEGSASAAEILAGAIQDTNSGVLIGTPTFGKGTVQTLLPVISGGGIRLTIAEYKTAGGRAVHHVGLMPDRYVKNTEKVVDTSYMVSLEMETAWKAGDTGQGVLAVEERLAFWNYMEEADTVADAETEAALRLFQAQNGLEVTGVADLYTQIRLNDADYDLPVEQDDQLRAAMEYLHEKA